MSRLISRSIVTSIFAASLLGSTSASLAGMAVTDAGANQQLILQLSEAKKALEVAQEARDTLEKQVNAIGELGKITIPLPNLQKIVGQLKSDAQCLLPNFEDLMPKVDFEDIDFGSVCDASDNYKKHYWISPKEHAKLSVDEKLAFFKELRERREKIVVEAVADGMAQADMGLKASLDLSDTAGEIDAAAQAAETSNDRLAVIAQAQAVLIRAQSQTNQLLAQQLRVQSAFVMAAGLDISSELAETEDDDDDSKTGEE